LIPGIGQMYAHEYRRGMGFMLGEIGSYVVAVSGLVIGYASQVQIGTVIGVTMMLGGALAFVTIPIWSVFDAVKVAKVNSMVG
jgi:Na+/phosphate symporter